MATIKKVIKKAVISSPLLQSQLSRVFGDFPRVFLYHRFSREGELLPHRVSADNFRWQLEQIVSRYKVLSFGDCVEHYMGKGVWPKNSAVITVDDGYRDLYEIAYPELRRLNLPATFFVTVNFVDQKIWLWPDRLHYAVNNSSHISFEICTGEQEHHYPLQTEEDKFRAWKSLSDYCISLDDGEKEQMIAGVEANMGLLCPPRPLLIMLR